MGESILTAVLGLAFAMVTGVVVATVAFALGANGNPYGIGAMVGILVAFVVGSLVDAAQ